MEILLATNNQKKLKELKAIFKVFDVDLLSFSDFNLSSPEETGKTFLENALIKARAGAAKTGLPTIADDSGLEVEALNGAPGVYSARYAGLDATDEDNYKKLLKELSRFSQNERKAQFRCVLAFVRPALDPEPIVSDEIWQGEIALNPSGKSGFGYDPVFYVKEHQCTAAELPSETKNKLSHRAQALKELIKKLEASNLFSKKIMDEKSG